MTANVSLRAVTAGDRGLLLRIYASSRAPEMELVAWSAEEKSAFLEQQFDLQEQHYRAAYEGAEFSIIVINGVDAGRLIVHRGPEWMELMDITLLEPWRNQGTGTRMVRALMEEAAVTRKSLRLWVEEYNAARRLYNRLGFVHAGDYGIHRELVFRPGEPHPKTAS